MSDILEGKRPKGRHVHLYGGPSDGKSVSVKNIIGGYPDQLQVFDEMENSTIYYLSEFDQACGSPIYTTKQGKILEFLNEHFGSTT